MVEVRNLGALARDAEEQAYLGWLLWYSIGGLRVTPEELSAMFDASGLSRAYFPPPIRAVDAFRRATSEVKVRRPLQGFPNGVRALLVRETECGPEKIVRCLVEERPGGKGRRPRYDPVGEMVFNRRAEGFYAALDAGHPLAEEAVERARRLYVEYRRHYTGEHLRRMAARVIDECRGVSVRPSGAVYFVPRAYGGVLESLEELFRLLRPASRGVLEFHRVPVVDMEEQRRMVAEKMEEHVRERLRQLAGALGGREDLADLPGALRECAVRFAGVLRARQEVPRGEVERAAEELRRLALQVREYEELLEASLDEARTALDLVRAQVGEMLRRMEAPPEGPAQLALGVTA
jgi:hypothetical protein